MKCKICGISVFRSINDSVCWKERMCGTCFYKKEYSYKKKIGHSEKIQKNYSIVTPNNIDLYCKLSKIIRKKPCYSKKMVLSAQRKEKRINLAGN